MSDDQSLNEFKKIVQRITEAETNDFFELAAMLGRNPKTDLAGANLNAVNLSGGDLRGANLRQTDLSDADLSQTDLSGADLTKSDLSCANLSGSNLTSTNFHDAKLEKARFINNQGLSESMKLDLKKRGAIVNDSSPENDINFEAYKKERKKWLGEYKGEYIVLVDGQLVDNDKSMDDLSKRVNLHYPGKFKFIKKIDDQEEKIIDIPINWN